MDSTKEPMIKTYKNSFAITMNWAWPVLFRKTQGIYLHFFCYYQYNKK